jgi:tryptophanyl-tRNA synthetase
MIGFGQCADLTQSKDTLGSDWYNLPRTNLTPELKRDLQVLRMRDVVAMGKQFFRKDSRKDFIPEYSQVGTIVAGATDGANGRLTRKEQKRTIVEEVLAGSNLNKFKNKYQDIQDQKKSGRKGHYKKLVAGRRKRNG